MLTLQDRYLPFIWKHWTKLLLLSSVHAFQVNSSKLTERYRLYLQHPALVSSILLPIVSIPFLIDGLGSSNRTQKSKGSISGPPGTSAFMESDSSFSETLPPVPLFYLSSQVYPINVIDTSHILVELISPNCLCLVTHRRVRFSSVVYHSTRFGLKQWN